jgi:curved DNA-binding protein CbpA
MSFDPEIDYYAVLGVLPSAEDAVIKAAYRALAQRYHPDKNPSNHKEATAKLAEINAAYAVLSNPTERAKYDSARQSQHGTGSTYFDESEDESEPKFDPLEARWKTALLYYPDLKDLVDGLGNISWRLSFAFKATLLDTRVFEQRAKLAAGMESEFLKNYFGTNPEILRFARELIKRKQREAARALNEAISVLGSDIDASRVIKQITKQFQVNGIRNEEEVLRIVKLRRAWGYDDGTIKGMLLNMGLTEQQAEHALSVS